jgi:hypothetical protein
MMALPHHMHDCFCNLFLKVLEWQQKRLGAPAMRDTLLLECWVWYGNFGEVRGGAPQIPRTSPKFTY